MLANYQLSKFSLRSELGVAHLLDAFVHGSINLDLGEKHCLQKAPLEVNAENLRILFRMWD